MKKWIPLKNREKAEQNRIAFKGGSYSLAITAVVLAILIAINILVAAMPTTMTKYDMSSSKLYSITSNTKAVVSALKDDVTIYWIVQSGEEDDVIENLLNKYDSLSDHIEIVKKNPDIYPTFAEQYTPTDVKNNSLVVECGTRNRFIGYDDIYVTQTDITTASEDASFDGEGAITSAIDYVTNEEQPQLYVLEGHGESALSSVFDEQIKKENIELNQFSLLTENAIPEEADCILIYAPTSDISVEEKDLLDSFLSGGGKMMVVAGPTENGTLTNLYSLLSDYGVETVDGVAADPDREHYAFKNPYILLPDMANSPITEQLINERYKVIMPVAQGLFVSESASSGVTPLLTTSPISFSKPDGYNLDSYEKEEGDIDGPFAVGVSVDCANDGQMVWFTSSDFLDDKYNALSAGGNLDIAMNSLASMIGESEAVAIRSKSLNLNYLTIDDSTASFIRFMMIGVFPILYIAIGISVVLKRRKQNESN